jgi:tRNA 2-selenouridine synthase
MHRRPQIIPFPEDAIADFDEIVDVRSPSEYAEDHVTGAINLPVLDDVERAAVGTIYKQVSPFEARKVGAALVSRNIAAHLETHFSGKGRDYRPLVYCWRGGQRSGSLALILAQIGWEVAMIEGGYRSYRACVLATIRERAGSLPYVVLNGYTGAGKTLLLHELAAMGEQVLDLESLASHKGSVFGANSMRPQPPQKRFESFLYDRIRAFSADRPVFLEAESAKIGRINLPNDLWQRMKGAPVIEIASPLAARASYLTSDYAEWLGDGSRVARALDRLKGFHADRSIAEWKAMAVAEDWESLVARLLSEHYDRRYPGVGDGHFQPPSVSLDLQTHDTGSVRRCACAIREHGLALARSLPAAVPLSE